MKSNIILLLGSGELGKELVIALKRLGETVIACDNYKGAPAMQVADGFEVFNMLDSRELDAVVTKHKPKLIVPEVESIRTECFYKYEKDGYTVVPSAKAANYTMNRKLIRDLAAKDLKIKTAKYHYARDIDSFADACRAIGFPCVAKPLMSSSGKGQSILKSEDDIQSAWTYGIEGSRGDLAELIVEEFIPFDYEITLLTLTQKNGETLFCPPIGHRQERGDYQESWQPCPMKPELLAKAQLMAEKVTQALEGAGIWGVEFFIAKDEVYFSELSPRPHDTGMVTMSGSQNLSEFELHARAILGYPVPEIYSEKIGVSSVILASKEGYHPVYKNCDKVMIEKDVDLRIFGKPTTRPYRRMGVVLASADKNTPMISLRDKAKKLADQIKIETKA